jgi:hypothetical protein
MPQYDSVSKKHLSLRNVPNKSTELDPRCKKAEMNSVKEVLHDTGRPLDPEDRSLMESRFRHDFSRVRVHTDDRASTSARSLDSLAYTVGQDIVFDNQHYSPETAPGRRLLSHELAHTLQQRTASAPSQTNLEVDSADSPLETAADQAADAFFRGQPLSAQPTAPGPLLSRQPFENSSTIEEVGQCRGTDFRFTPPMAAPPSGPYTITSVETISVNERRVRTSSGRRYLVRRIPWTRVEEGPETRSSVRPGIDREQVWLEVSFCRGNTEGTIRVGANVPEQAIQLVLQTIVSGGDVAAAWRQASITPSFSGSLRVGRWQADLNAQTTIDSSGRDTSVGGDLSVSAQTPQGIVGGGISLQSQDVGGNPLGGVQGQVFFRFQWGESRSEPSCTRMRVRSGFNYECYEERATEPTTQSGIRPISTREERLYNVFFVYAQPTFDDSRNIQTWQDITSDLQNGYQVVHIEGWTSPEGSMEQRRGRRFPGNTLLSQQRANAARDRIVTLPAAASVNRFAPGLEVVGSGERMDPTDASGQPVDVAGPVLERHVTRTFPTDTGESSVRTPQLLQDLSRIPSTHGRAERIYPELRRAIVTLRRSVSSTEACTYTVEGGLPEEAFIIGGCPDDIRQAAFPDTDFLP